MFIRLRGLGTAYNSSFILFSSIKLLSTAVKHMNNGRKSIQESILFFLMIKLIPNGNLYVILFY